MFNGTSNVAVLIPWCNRPELQTTLIKNRLIFALTKEVIIANGGGKVTQLQKLALRADLPSLAILNVPMGRFNKSQVINIAALSTRARKLLILDNDVLIEGQTLLSLARRTTESRVTTVRDVNCVDDNFTTKSGCELSHFVRIRLRVGGEVKIETSRTSVEGHGRSGAGLVCVTRRAFLSVDGMNSRLRGWGWEDIDLLIRLQLALGIRREQFGRVTHLSPQSIDPGDTVARKVRSQSFNWRTSLVEYMRGNLSGTLRADADHCIRSAYFLRSPSYSRREPFVPDTNS
jgi:N-terminal domain of galactosyltransferase